MGWDVLYFTKRYVGYLVHRYGHPLPLRCSFCGHILTHTIPETDDDSFYAYRHKTTGLNNNKRINKFACRACAVRYKFDAERL